MKRGDIVTERYRVPGFREDLPDHVAPAPRAMAMHGETPQRKVYVVIGPSRVPGKVRLSTWSHAGRRWCTPQTWIASWLCPAPDDWPQTQAARRDISVRGVPS